MPSNRERHNQSRRRFLAYTKSTLVPVSMVGLAGCSGSSSQSTGDGNESTPTGNSSQSTGDGNESTSTGSARGDRQTDQLRVGIRSEPEGLAPTDIQTQFAAMIAQQIFDTPGLYNYDTGEMQGGLVTDWHFEDDKHTLVCKVREEVQWHRDYGELTAEDFVFKTNKIVEEDLPESFIYGGDQLKGAEQRNKYTFQYNFKQPLTPFVRTVFIRSFIGSKAAFQDMSVDEYARNPIGTGPYVFEEWSQGNQITLSKNENYWGEPYPYANEIIVRFVPNATTQLDLLKAGELDIIDQVAVQETKSVQQSDQTKAVRKEPGWNVGFMMIGGPKSGRKDLQNPKVRKAINYGINRNDIAQGAYFGEAVPTDAPLPPSMEENALPEPTDFYPKNSDIDEAKKLLSEAGYGDGIDAELLVANNAEDTRVVQVIKENLSQIGINVSIKAVDRSTYLASTAKQEWELTFHDITLAGVDPDNAVFWFWHSDGVANDQGYSNEQVDKWLLEQRALTDLQKRGELLYKVLEKILTENPAYAYTTHRNLIRGFRSNINWDRSIPPRTQDFEWQWMWKT